MPFPYDIDGVIRAIENPNDSVEAESVIKALETIGAIATDCEPPCSHEHCGWYTTDFGKFIATAHKERTLLSIDDGLEWMFCCVTAHTDRLDARAASEGSVLGDKGSQRQKRIAEMSREIEMSFSSMKPDHVICGWETMSFREEIRCGDVDAGVCGADQGNREFIAATKKEQVMKHVYALTYEYSYPNNNDGRHSPEDAGGVLRVFEDEDDANAMLKHEQDSGEWGNFDEEVLEENCGWSSAGYILSVEMQEIVPSSKKPS